MTVGKNSWKDMKWGDLATLAYGKALRRGEYVEGPYPVYGTNGQIGWHERPLCLKEGIIIGRKGAYRGVHYSKKPFFVIDTAFYLVPKSDFDIKWAYYQLLNFDINNLDSGSAIPSTSREAFYEIPVKVPPIDVQREIASILSAYDDLIENNTRRIKILEEMAQSLYREWFINFRFPGHEKTKMVDSPLGKIPKEWVPVKLSEVASINEASIRKKGEPERIHYVDIASVSTGTVDSVEDVAFSDAPGRARRIVKHGDIIWATVRPYRKSYSLIFEPPSNLIVSTGFAVITPRTVPFSFLYQALTTDNFVDYLTNCAKGSAYPAVSSEDFYNAPLLLPTDELLNEFHKVVEPLFEKKQNLALKNINLEQTRNLLLPTLISEIFD